MNTKTKYGKWVITCKNGLWEANYSGAKVYVNFSQEPDTSLENIKRILDSAALRREQDARVLKRLKELEDYLKARFVLNPRTQQNTAKRGEEINVGRALCEIKDKRLFRLTSDPEGYLEIDRVAAKAEAQLRALLDTMSPADCEAFFNSLTYHQLEILYLSYGIQPSDYKVSRKDGPAQKLVMSTGAGKCFAMLEVVLKGLRPS